MVKETKRIKEINEQIVALTKELNEEKDKVALERCPFKPGSLLRHKETGEVIKFEEPTYIMYEPGYLMRCRRFNKTTGLLSKRAFFCYEPDKYEQK